jgi:phosphoribosylglycinamide formyltransferase-1
VSTKRLVILISGRGSNMAALLGAKLPADVAAVISNVPGAAGLATAHSHGISTHVVDHRAYPDRLAFDSALGDEIERHSPDLVVLAGFMRILGDGFIGRFSGRLMNIHPSLLPAFLGLHTHRRVLASGARIHGCTVHLVTAELDAGPIVVQAAVPVLAGDTEESLAERVLEQEHRIYPMAVRWFCEGRVRLLANGGVEVAHARADTRALISPAPDA